MSRPIAWLAAQRGSPLPCHPALSDLDSQNQVLVKRSKEFSSILKSPIESLPFRPRAKVHKDFCLKFVVLDGVINFCPALLKMMLNEKRDGIPRIPGFNNISKTLSPELRPAETLCRVAAFTRSSKRAVMSIVAAVTSVT